MISVFSIVSHTVSTAPSFYGVVHTVLTLYLSVSYWIMCRTARNENKPSGWIALAAAVSIVALLTAAMPTVFYWASLLDLPLLALFYGASGIFSLTAVRIYPSGVWYMWMTFGWRRGRKPAVSCLARESSMIMDWGASLLILMFLVAWISFARTVLSLGT